MMLTFIGVKVETLRMMAKQVKRAVKKEVRIKIRRIKDRIIFKK